MDEFKIVSDQKVLKDLDGCLGDKYLSNMAEKYARLLTGKSKTSDWQFPKPVQNVKPKRKRGCY